MLKLSNNLSLPKEAITETFGVLAARGAGKSNTAAVMAEEMFDAGLPFCVIDPVGSWWGLRSNGKGTGPGIPIAIFGGPKGDVPLERNGGQLVADIVVGQRLSCVLDLRNFESEAAKKHFLLDFARRLYTKNEAPLHLFLEEADDYIPQRPMRDEAQLLRAWENIVRRGRARGLGMTMITQRSAVINKNVLTQVQTLIAMRTTGPQDRKAIEEWLKYNDQSKDILESLPGLADGEAWVWSPQFLKRTVRVQFRRRHTFDSGSTPKMAAKGKTATLADIDVTALRSQMADTIERAEAEDPKALKRRIAELQGEIRKISAKAERGPAPAVDPGLISELEHNVRIRNQELNKRRDFVRNIASELGDVIPKLEKLLARLQLSDWPDACDPKVMRAPAQVRPAAVKPRPIRKANGESKWALGKGERKVLIAIAQHSEGVDREQISILAGYKRSTRDAYIQRLAVAGLVDLGPPITTTEQGYAELPPDFEPLPTGSALREHWLATLPAGEKAVLEVLVAAYPNRVSRDEISAHTDYKRSTRDAYIQRLGVRKLAKAGPDGVVANENLF
jgi:hypothetical protein